MGHDLIECLESTGNINKHDFKRVSSKNDPISCHSSMFYCVYWALYGCSCVSAVGNVGWIRGTLVIKKQIFCVPWYVFSIKCHLDSELLLLRDGGKLALKIRHLGSFLHVTMLL